MNAFGTKIKNLVSQIQEMKEAKIDKIVLVLHWGIELEILLHPVQIQMARELVDAGADTVVGHHSHLIQAFGILRESQYARAERGSVYIIMKKVGNFSLNHLVAA